MEYIYNNSYMNTNNMKNSYNDLILSNAPYQYMLTLTFCRSTSFSKSVSYVSSLLNRMNRKIFGRDYLNHPDKHIKGFASYEDHLSVHSNNGFTCIC